LDKLHFELQPYPGSYGCWVTVIVVNCFRRSFKPAGCCQCSGNALKGKLKISSHFNFKLEASSLCVTAHQMSLHNVMSNTLLFPFLVGPTTVCPAPAPRASHGQLTHLPLGTMPSLNVGMLGDSAEPVPVLMVRLQLRPSMAPPNPPGLQGGSLLLSVYSVPVEVGSLRRPFLFFLQPHWTTEEVSVRKHGSTFRNKFSHIPSKTYQKM